MRRLLCTTSVLLLLASPGAYGEGFYAGGGLGFGQVKFSDDYDVFYLGDDDTIVAVKGIGGYRANDFIALEVNLTGAANDGDDDYDEVTFAALSASILLIAPASERFDLFLRGGYYTGESDVGYRDDEDESGYVIGGGGQVSFGSRNQFSVRVEYEYFDTDDLDEIWAISGGFFYNFGQKGI